jgi:hypothetical protein
MKLSLTIFTFILFCNTILAQNISSKLSGIVFDEDGKPFPGATITLMSRKDSSLQKVAISNEQGKFEIVDVKEGQYILVVTSIGYETNQRNLVTVDQQRQSIEVPVIKMQQSSARMLKGVSVVAKKPLVEQRIDRLIVNVDALIANAGTNALDVLSRSPGIMVGSDGSITLSGKGGVMVLIDGRPTYLGGQDLVNYLRSLPSGALDKVEIMTNPPARYEASGNGVINIRTKKNKASGLNGTITAGYSQGMYWRSNNTLDVNYRTEKVNLFANAGYTRDMDYTKLNTTRLYKNPDGSPNSGIIMDSRYKSAVDAMNGRFGIDYFISPRTVWGVVLTGVIRPRSEDVLTTSNLNDASGKLDSVTRGTMKGDYRWKNGSANMNLLHRFDSNGKELTVDLDYVKYTSNGDQLAQNDIYLPNNTLANSNKLTGILPVDINIYSAKADYAYPLRKQAKIEAGAKTSYVKTDNAASYFTESGGVTLPDYDKTNRFKYNENINAAYLNFSKEFGRFALQAGVRMENTVANGHQLGNVAKPDSSFKKNYTDVFPTAYLSYKLDSTGNNTLVLSYGRRIDRPAYQNLNPFLYYYDKFTYRGGNPFLKPQYTDHLELRYGFRQYLIATLLFDRTTDLIMQTIEQSGSIFIDRSANIGRSSIWGLRLNSSLEFTKWWTCHIFAEALNYRYKGVLYGENLDQQQITPFFSVLNQFKFDHGWSAELFWLYRGKSVTGQFTRDPITKVDIGLQKNLLNDKASIRLTAKDIFYSFIFKGQINNIKQGEAFDRNLLDSRVFGVTFSYRFGKDAQKRNRKTGSSESEQNRVKPN